ncbi:unnamed protein product [Medioppia subpectinata]|uniref:Anti-silencing function protein 1 n=1 Tax=Medioppia subpectinata TaxID=1979941 RepID=A0A7R9KAW5_9ACAR|nr:unnamed protein product [Medioppia subpectinata]CAG2100029.1 unnamed protein product [Medioppia subpectinata]
MPRQILAGFITSTNDYDQEIYSCVVGPFKEGEHLFEMETDCIDLTKIPISTLFGLTTILVSCKYNGEQFLRIGYLVDVRYPGIKTECLTDEMGTSDDEGSIEILEDEELEDDDEEEEGEKEDGTDEDLVDSGEDINVEVEEDLDAEEPKVAEKELTDDIISKENIINIPLETPIKFDVDEFEYKGHLLLKSKIEFVLHEQPIIQAFGLSGDEDESEKFEDSTSQECVKKACLD